MAAEKTFEVWNELYGGRARTEWESYLVRVIRIWRPEVIVTRESSSEVDNPVGRLVSQAILQAVSPAADPKACSDQIVHAGLEPWQVRRVFAALAPGLRGDINLSSGQVAERIGRSLEDLAFDASALIDTRFRLRPPSQGFQVLFDQTPQNRERPDFFAGISLSPRGEARRATFEVRGDSLDLVHRIAQKRHTIQAVIAWNEKDSRGGAEVLAQIGALTGTLDARSAAAVLFTLGQQYYQTGQWPLAAEVFELLVERYAEDPVARPARVWLVQYYSSGEAACRAGSRHVRGVTAWEARDAEPGVARPASAYTVRPVRHNDQELLAAAASMTVRLQQSRPELLAEPTVAFALAAADRKRRQPRQADLFYTQLSRGRSHDAWWACAQGELWLAEPKGPPPKPVLRCPVIPATAPRRPAE